MFKTIAATSLLASTALAQISSPLEIAQLALNFLSPTCQQTVLQLANSSSPVYQCLQINSLLPALTTNGSIIAPVDDYLSAICYNSPCNSTLLNQTANAVAQGCAADLASVGIDNQTVSDIFGLYPLARDVVCLKNNQTEFLSNATIPLNSTAYNSTNGTFCLTEFATNITGYLDVNLTNSYIDTLLLGGNFSAIQAIEAIPDTALCSDCIFAAVNLIEEQYPKAGSLIVNDTTNATINGYLNQTCQATGLNVTYGFLPAGINEVAKNGTNSTTIFPSFTSIPAALNGTAQSTTSAASARASSVTSALAQATASGKSATAAAASSASKAIAGRMAEKKRWVGEQ